MNDPVIDHFHNTAISFDSIYSGKKSPIGRYLDRLLRWDMIERLKKTIEVVQSFKDPSIIDIGAGSGRFFQPMLQAGARKITAVEPAENMIKVAIQLIKEQKLMDVEIIPDSWLNSEISEVHDVVIAIGFFDYIENCIPSLKKAHSFTKKAFVASFPKSGTIRSRIRKARLDMKSCPTYYYSKSQVIQLVKDAGFKKWEISSFGQLFFVVGNP